MPIYEYDCPQCGRFEVTQRITELPLSTHECGRPVVRAISRTAFALKGGGWYADGYGSNAKTGGGASSSTSSEAKPGP